MKPLKFGIIGFGFFGKHYARVLKKIDNVEVVAVANPSDRVFLDLDPSIKRFKSGFKLIEDPEIDCVIIASPSSTHFDLAEAAILRKKHILVEKPMVKNISEAKKIKALLRGYDKCFMVGHIYLYNDNINLIKKYIKGGRLGKVNNIFFEQLSPGPIRKDIDVFREVGVHHISILEHIFGHPKKIDVEGKISKLIKDGKGETVSIILDYGGILVNISASLFSPEKRKVMIFRGDKGSLIFDDISHEVRFYKLRPKIKERLLADPIIINFPLKKEPQLKEVEHFVDCVRNSKKPLTGIENGFLITEMVEGISKKIENV